MNFFFFSLSAVVLFFSEGINGGENEYSFFLSFFNL